MMGKPPQLPSSGMLTSDGRRGLFGVGVAILGFAVFIPDVARSSDTGEDAEELLRLSLSCPLEPLKSASANTNPSYKATKTPTYKSVGDKRNLKIIMTREDRTYFDTINKVSVVKVIEAQDALYQNFSPRIKIRPRSDFPGSVWEVTAFCSVSLKGGEAEGCMSYSMGTVPDKADARYSYKGDKLRFLVCDEENANNAKAALEELITAAKDAETAAPAAVKQSTPDASGLKATIESTNKKSSKNPNSDGLSKTLTIKTE